MSTARTEDDTLEAEVLAYLAEHPGAMDTLSGIATWWLERQRIRVDVLALARVVHRLVEAGKLQEVRVGDDPLYRLRELADRGSDRA